MCTSLFKSLLLFGEKFNKIRKNYRYLEHLLTILILVAIIAVSLLSIVLLYKLEKAQEKAQKKEQEGFYLAGLLFFVVVYLILLVFYGYCFFKAYWKPKYQKQ
jgi:cell division protein FtsW (lipid II flippase)